jgi:hypothetical protein
MNVPPIKAALNPTINNASEYFFRAGFMAVPCSAVNTRAGSRADPQRLQ